ncbi:MAG: 3-isopropylmalate dehydratase small subunit 1 [Fimbriimonadaceae bacterium]|nr:3-isopropylmalate dehydratase small subunit 1 [Fimbriimonadaceae bacterium]
MEDGRVIEGSMDPGSVSPMSFDASRVPKFECMSGFAEHSGKLAVYAADHVDTDRIIPARFLSMVTKSGYGQLLFKDVRDPNFPLDQPEAQGASILVVGTNFGCGSSREHAVWAIQQAGFKAVIAVVRDDSPGFSDIFRQNANNCGLLLIELPPNQHEKLVAAGSGAKATVDLNAKVIGLGSDQIPFDISEAHRRQIIEGLDLIGMTLQHADEIGTYEANTTSYIPARSQ